LREAAARSGGDFTDVGLAYIAFALGHRAHFDVMFRPELLQRGDPELVAAMQASSLELRAGASQEPATTATADPEAEMIAAWSLVHGFATLWLSGTSRATSGPPTSSHAASAAPSTGRPTRPAHDRRLPDRAGSPGGSHSHARSAWSDARPLRLSGLTGYRTTCPRASWKCCA
jgi:hypothetical protein